MAQKNNLIGQVFNIQRYSTHDGPGIRTTVFLKGCPLRCKWCQNPESQSLHPVLMFRADECTSCGRCIDACPNKANSIVDGKLVIDWERCTACGACTSPAVCLSMTRKVEGKPMTVEEVMKQVSSDYNLYLNSGGGLTISGGDCAVQPEFTAALLKKAQEEGINTCVEITGAYPWERVQQITEDADYVYYDLKCMDDEKHKEGTGVSNRLILENARKLVEAKKQMLFRTPLIPGFNDDKENIEATASFIKNELGLSPSEHLELLAYNNLGEDKYLRLGFSEPQRHARQSDKYLDELEELVMSF